jgi:hypothetical protein
MKTCRLLIVTLSAAALLYAWLSWPLPLHFTTGIPAAAHPTPSGVQPMIPGDHLQLLYHFQLVGDMLTGDIKPFYNLYEFNIGDDSERFMPGSYYFPFSILYAAGDALAGPAGGWNLASLISIWLTLFFTWLLARRFTGNRWIAALATLVGLCLPFRWINLFGGSPAGFAMAWPPAIWLGVDLAIRQRRVSGGFLAGLGVLMACWCDTHVFFFSVLAIPFWCLIAVIMDNTFTRPRPQYLRIILALLPLVVLTLASLAFPAFLKWITIRVTGTPPEATAITGRTLREIQLYSPPLRGLFDGRIGGLSEHIFIGLSLPLLIGLGGLAWCIRACKGWQARWRRPVAWLLLCCMIALVCLLAAGVYGIGDGAVLQFFRRIIPPYRMIRQPAKIFTLMPSLLTVAITLAGGALFFPSGQARRWGTALFILLAATAICEYGRRINLTISLLSPDQAAYAAVADDAADRGHPAHALVLPLWPGDSHYTSIYQFYAANHNLRMVNGYRPFFRRNYLTNVFERLVSANQGWITDDQLAHLDSMGVEYILLHEDLFPEKVSPFPVGATLQNLLRHPQLQLLHQDQSVWAFAIRPPDGAGAAYQPDWDVFGSTRRWGAEKIRSANTHKTQDQADSERKYLALEKGDAWIQTPHIWTWGAPDLRWLVRTRGHGLLQSKAIIHETALPLDDLAIDSADWRWQAVPADVVNGYAPLSLNLEWQGGAVEIDTILLTAGRWDTEPDVGETISIPAPCFFHAGYINPASDSVILRRERDPQALIFYGPKLPLTPGRYRAELHYSSVAPSGTPTGQFNIRQRSTDPIYWTPVFAGHPATAEFDLPDNFPFHLELLFNGQADLKIHRVDFTRLK